MRMLQRSKYLKAIFQLLQDHLGLSGALGRVAQVASTREEVLEAIEGLVALGRPTYHLDVDLRTASDNSLPEVDTQMVLECSKRENMFISPFTTRVETCSYAFSKGGL